MLTFHPRLGPLARLAIVTAVFAPSLGAAYLVWLGLTTVDAPEWAAGFLACVVALAGIIGIAHSIETRILRREARQQP